ncbi:5-(carboxyamino)imidazole ribonucleotide mutase [Candidatus Saccharibacteria bacterium]|nr:5-(carboxyamino)imidazole ribonucleotide mutase [Candidatus Saccharibacteria bacterium]
MTKPLIGIVMGSDSDLGTMGEVAKTLDEFGVAYEMRIISAHRTPNAAAEYASEARERGLKIIIAGAGMSAHLAGVLAAYTTLPIISIPLRNPNHGHEALWSNIAMPPGITLATMPENGCKNAALYAVEILALADQTLATKYNSFRQKQSAKVVDKDTKLGKLGWQKYLDS